MSAGLPAALQDAIARFAGEFAPKELASRSAALTETYRSGGASDTAVSSGRDVAAYLTTRLPATYAAMAAALGAVKERAPYFAPTSVLDAGSGPGTASWAAAEAWPLQSVTMLDRNPHLLAAARALATGSETLAKAQFVAGDLSAVDPSASYDLVLAGYTFAEIPDRTREAVLARLWQVCRGVLVIVEPGTPKGFASVLACRTILLAAGARMVAPCPGSHPCPIVAPDWCHFAERLPRSRAHMRAKAASVPFEDEKFSYVAVAREGVALEPIEARIIAPPHAAKPGTRLSLCTPSGIGDRVVLKRDKPAYQAVSRKTWGDSL